MSSEVFTGFMDGINDSLTSGYEVEKLEEDSEIELKLDFEKLYYNMLDAKAKWLYTLSNGKKCSRRTNEKRSPKPGAKRDRSSTRTKWAETTRALRQRKEI